jgi:hypothetical protein
MLLDKSVMKELPKYILNILGENHAPLLLQRHLTLVYNVGIDITDKLTQAWPNLEIIEEEILFGTSSHDIGKIFEVKELHQTGNKHEITGYEFLIGIGISENLARFTKTHGNWTDESIKIEDLIVTHADKIWKGKRIDELEERLSVIISKNITADYWDVYTKLDAIISDIIVGADIRLNWQNNLE